MSWKSLFIILLAGWVVCGCSTVPANPLNTDKGDVAAMKEIMARKNQIVYLSLHGMDNHKPMLLLLHGATEDPTEMMDIAREWRDAYDVFLYAYNYHRPLQKVAADFDKEIKRLRMENRFGGDVTIVVYSYAAVVFREAVIANDDRNLFSNTSLIQLVPIAGGSYLARGIKNPLTGWVVCLFSHPTHAVDPYGSLAEKLWAGAGNQKFYTQIPPGRVHTILVENDGHSVARMTDQKIQEHYKNGIGPNIVVIPRSAGVIHENAPTNPVALEYLRELLEPSDEAAQGTARSTAQK